ncbi:MAG: lectin like domain-containing protein, partial [Clostridium sp.]|nr:lectin like domain-containing protein [Clostridium sp.]
GKKIYQYDEFGPTAYIYSIDNETNQEKQLIECANVYDFKGGYDILEGIMFMTSSIGAKYKISYAKFEENNVYIDENKTMLLAEGIVSHAGFITIPLDGIKVPEGKGYIMVSIDNSQNNKAALIGAETLSDECVRKIDKGESYMVVENYAIDCFDYSNEGNEENYTIKVIARNTKEKIIAQEVLDKQKEALNESTTSNNSNNKTSNDVVSEKRDFILVVELVAILIVVIFFIKKRN